MNSTLVRRLITIPASIVLALVVTVLAPVWLVATLIVSLAPQLRGCTRFALFVWGYLCCETIGIVACFWLWVRFGFCRRGHPRYRAFLRSNDNLQRWWADRLLQLGKAIFSLRIELTGHDATAGPNVIFVPRHVSIGDTVIPTVFYSHPHGRRLRHVLKRELLIDPCLDIVGNRLPNYFVDRASDDPEQEMRSVATLLDGRGENEGVLIYPEGTRFSESKRRGILGRLSPDRRLRAQSWTHLLPPRYGGILALLGQNPGLDLLFCAHSGLEGSASFASLINGSWTRSTVRIHFWRVPFSEIPGDDAEHRAFFDECWDRMQAEVEKLNRAAPT